MMCLLMTGMLYAQSVTVYNNTSCDMDVSFEIEAIQNDCNPIGTVSKTISSGDNETMTGSSNYIKQISATSSGSFVTNSIEVCNGITTNNGGDLCMSLGPFDLTYDEANARIDIDP